MLRSLLLAGLGLCAPVQAATSTELFYHQWQPYDWPGQAPTAQEVTRSQRGIRWQTDTSAGATKVQYDYQPLRIRTGQPAHNGHLHRFTVGGSWQQGPYRVQGRAGLAGTSNMFKEQDFHRKVANGRLALFRAISDDARLSLGVGGDHRFGSFRWLPRVRWAHASDQGHWLLDLPVLAQWKSPDRLWTVSIRRVGDRWATLDRARQVESALYLEEWRAEIRYRMYGGTGAWPDLLVGLGASVDTRVRYRDLNTGTRDLHLGETLLGNVTLRW